MNFKLDILDLYIFLLVLVILDPQITSLGGSLPDIDIIIGHTRFGDNGQCLSDIKLQQFDAPAVENGYNVLDAAVLCGYLDCSW